MDIQNLVRERVVGNVKTGMKGENGLPKKLSYFHNEEREEKIALLKFTYEQIQASQSEQTAAKDDVKDNTSSILEILNKDINSINFENKANLRAI